MKIPLPLLDGITSGKCLPFVGAGFSLNAKLPEKYKMPDWSGLKKVMAKAIGVSEMVDGPEVASAFERLFGRVQLIETIRKALHSDLAEPGKAHRAFAQLPFDTVYTTNFDLLLEEANSLLRRPYRSLVGELQMPFHGGPLTTSIVKMHGDLRHEEHVIVTKEDYADFLNRYFERRSLHRMRHRRSNRRSLLETRQFMTFRNQPSKKRRHYCSPLKILFVNILETRQTLEVMKEVKKFTVLHKKENEQEPL